MELRTYPLPATSQQLEKLADKPILGTAEDLGRPGLSTPAGTTEAGSETSKAVGIPPETRGQAASAGTEGAAAATTGTAAAKAGAATISAGQAGSAATASAAKTS